MGLLPDAQSCTSCSRSGNRGRTSACDRRSPSSLYPSHQFPGRLARSSLAGRFSSYVMDETYLIACVRHIETNPVRARLANKPEDWPWSSAAAHMRKESDRLVNAMPLLQMITGGIGTAFFLLPGQRRIQSY